MLFRSQGLLYLKDTFFSYGFVITVMLGVVALVFHLISCGGTTWSKSPERLYMGLVAIVVIAYVVKIGGDAFHYRYLAFSYVLLLCSLGGSLEILFIQAVSGFYKYLIVTLAIFSCAWAFLGVPRQLEKHPLYFPNVRTKIVDRIEDGPCFHRSWPIIKQFSKWRFKLTPEQIESGPAEGIGYNRKKILTIVTAAMFYQKIFNYGIQAPGFADRDLAFINVSAARPGHKPAVRPYLHDIEGLIESGLPRERGMYRKAVENGIASKWMLRNLHTLEKLEKRTFNQHLFFANLKLAFMRIDRIEPREDDFQLVRHVSLNQ